MTRFSGGIPAIMASEDDFEPRLGRMRSRGKGARPRKTIHRILAAANLARGGAVTGRGKTGFTGSRIGRGAGAGRVIAGRDRYAAFRQRRVIVKARTISLKGRGFEGAKAHLRYVERDGTSREGERGKLYGPDSDSVDRVSWLEKGQGDRHQFRFIVSPEDGHEYEDLKSLTKRLMTRVEEDLGTRLDWVAVDHFNTGHPHTHIIVRGKDDRGRDLVIARDYISHGLRERASELVDLDLGPRTDDAIAQRLRAEVEQERFTNIDRSFVREASENMLVSVEAKGPFDQAVRTGRLQKLARLGLATRLGPTHWQLVPGLESTLRKMGERGDIIRTMQRSYTARGASPAPSDIVIFEPRDTAGRGLVGRVVERGLSDEHADRHYLIIEATDGRSHYVAIGKSSLGPTGRGSIVRIVPAEIAVREADRTIVSVATANEGRYSVDAHLRFDRDASEDYAESHVRRLEAMRRLAGGVDRLPDGSWLIASDHLDRALAYEAARVADRPVNVETLSPVPLDRLISADAATWLDRELIAGDRTTCREAGFGGETRSALTLRRQWLLSEALATEEGGRVSYRGDMLDVLRRREVEHLSANISAELQKPVGQLERGDRVEGRLVRAVNLISGRMALVERSRDFVLVPWRPVLERQIGKPVVGLARHESISWQFGKQRAGPSVT
jgi:type IV secretory pathway VirD2 relaxase